MKTLLWPIFLALILCACENQQVQTENAPKVYVDLDQDIQAEWTVFVKKHPELSQTEALKEFLAIQSLSARARTNYADASTFAALNDRKMLANAMLKKEVETVFKPSDVTEDMIRAAFDAFAFDSGHPALQTVSHLLLRESNAFDDASAKQTMERIRQNIIDNNELNDEALKQAALELTRAGQRSEMNANLSFPRRELPSFMGLQQRYQTMVEPFAEAAFQLTSQNRLSPVVRTEFGYHLILLKESRPPYQSKYEDIRLKLRDKILEHARKLATQQLLESMQNNASIRVDEDLLKRVASGEI